MDGGGREPSEDLGSKILCNECGKPFAEPKVLHCLHCYCRVCIESLAQKSQGESIICPKCQYETTLPDDKVSNLKDACFLNRLKRKVERQRWLSNTNEAKCELCTTKSRAVKFCLNCEKFICDSCVGKHSELTILFNHNMYSLEDFRREQPELKPTEEHQAICKIHNLPYHYYCIDCNDYICRHCTEDEKHKEHQYDKLSSTTSKATDIYKNELFRMKKLLLNLEDATKKNCIAKFDIKAKEKCNIQELDAVFDKLHKILMVRQQELVNVLKEHSEAKYEKVLKQEGMLSRVYSEVQGIMQFTEQCINHSSHKELMGINDIIEKRITEVQITSEEALKPLQEDVAVEVACAEDQLELCRSLVFVTEKPSQENLVEIVDDASAAVKCEKCYSDLILMKKAFNPNGSAIVCFAHADGNAVRLDSLTVKCSIHKTKKLKAYCLDCKINICSKCRSKGGAHENHSWEDLAEVAQMARDELKRISHSTDLHERLKGILENIHSTKRKIKGQEKSIISSLRNSSRELRSILSEYEREYIENVKITTRKKLESLSGQEQQLSITGKKLWNSFLFTKECIKHLHDADIMRLQTLLVRKLSGEVSKLKSDLDSYKPLERDDIGVEVLSTEALHQLYKTQTSLFKKIDPLNCLVYMKEASNIGVPFLTTVITKIGEKSETSKRSGKISSTVESLRDGVVADCSIYENELGTFTLTFTPIVCGSHKMTILVDDQYFPESPYSFFISVNPASLQVPVRVWENINKPCGGIANSQHEILAIENYERIIKLTPDGHVNVLVQNCGLQKLSAIVCDDKDNIFGVDELSKRIFTCDRNGDNVQVHEVELINSKGRSALLILDNELITTDRGETRDTLCFYNREFNLVKSIELTNIVRDMSADSYGNVYATDSDNCCVHVFSKHEFKLQTLNLDKKYIQNPSGISTFGQQIYLTDCVRHRVVAFSTDGTFIAPLGTQQDELLLHPFQVFVDIKGFVYVFDLDNNKIVCF